MQRNDKVIQQLSSVCNCHVNNRRRAQGRHRIRTNCLLCLLRI